MNPYEEAKVAEEKDNKWVRPLKHSWKDKGDETSESDVRNNNTLLKLENIISI